jgi:phosphotransferase system enzyme I (PtsP)
VIDQHMQAFSVMDDPYLRERMADVRDLGLRILAHLQKQEESAPRDFPDQAILVGDDITTAMLVETPLEKIAGIVTVTGAANSHMAIVARALGIPTVVGVSDLPVTQLDDTELIVDAYQGAFLCSRHGNCGRATKKSLKKNGSWWRDWRRIKICRPLRPTIIALRYM